MIYRYLVSVGGFSGGSDGKESTCNVGDLDLIPGWGRSLVEGKANHSIILARRIPWTQVSDGLQFMGSQRVRHGWVTTHSTTKHSLCWVKIRWKLCIEFTGFLSVCLYVYVVVLQKNFMVHFSCVIISQTECICCKVS